MVRTDPDREGKVQRGRVKDKLSKVLVVGTVQDAVPWKRSDIVFNRSGMILVRVSEVAMHLVNTWTMSSSGAQRCGERDWQRRQ